MKQVWILVIVFLAACGARASSVMTGENFQKTHVGMSEEALVKKYGHPLNTYCKDNGDVIYEYVERFQLGGATNNTIEARRYYFTIRNHKIMSKRMVIANQPAYEPMNQL